MARLEGTVRASIARTRVTLVCDVNALCLMESQIGAHIDDIMHRYDAGQLRLGEERAVLAAMLDRHHGPADLETFAGDLMSADLEACKRAISETILAALPEAKPGKKPMAAAGLTAWMSRRFCWPFWRRAIRRGNSGI